MGRVAYGLALPSELSKINNIFQVSMLRRYKSYPSYVLPVEFVEVQTNLTYEEKPAAI